MFSTSVILTAVLVFCARLLDVSIGTLRIISLAKGRRYLAPILAFVEILIWLTAIRQIILNASNTIVYIAFAGGFALGNFFGILLEEKLALGMVYVRIVTPKDATALVSSLRDKGFGLTILEAAGTKGKVDLIFTIIKRKSLGMVVSLIKQHNPMAFYSVSEIHTASHVYHPEAGLHRHLPFNFLTMRRKAK